MVSESKEWSSKRSAANDCASTSVAAARKVSKVLKTWQRHHGSQWVILKRLTLLLVLTVLAIAVLEEGFLPLSIVGIPLALLLLLYLNRKHLHDGDSPKHRDVKNALGSQRK